MIKDFIKNLITNIFKLTGNIVNLEHTERWVYEYGNVLFFRHPKLNQFVAEPVLLYRTDTYGVVSHISTITLKNVKLDPTKHFMYLPECGKMPLNTINRLASDIDYLLSKQIKHHKLINLPLLFKGDVSQLKVLGDYSRDNNIAVIKDDSTLSKGLQQIPVVLNEFDFKGKIDANFALIKNLLGFDFYDTMKKERMIVDEAEQYNDWSDSVFAIYLNSRLETITKLSEQGVNIQLTVSDYVKAK